MKLILRYTILWHRWLGIFACLLFMLWFATGLVLHFVHFPQLDAEEKFAGLKPIELQNVKFSVHDAIHRFPNFEDITNVKLVMSDDRPVYIAQDQQQTMAIYADTGELVSSLSHAEVVDIAKSHAIQRGFNIDNISHAALEEHDQWTVSNGLDPYRPLHRIALNDKAGTELYISDVTGEVLRDTTQSERAWNYVGAVIHWIYPTVLRKHFAVWNWLVWTISLVSLIAAITGVYLGIQRLRWKQEISISPYCGMHYLHHVGGIVVSAFLLTYIFSGWLSMDHGLLFSNNSVSALQRATLAGGRINWQQLATVDISVADGAKQLAWVQLAGKPYVIATSNHDAQKVFGLSAIQYHFEISQFDSQHIQLLDNAHCQTPTKVADDDAYKSAAIFANAPLLRVVCKDNLHTWFHIDAANAQIVGTLNDSKRLYRWLYDGLHTLNFNFLNNRPNLKTLLVIFFSATGFVFSLTGVVLSWRRLKLFF